MSNAVNTVKSATTIVAKLAAGMLAEKAKFVASIAKEDNSVFNKQFESVQPGSTINVTKPARFTVGTTADITGAIQDVKEELVPLALNQRSVVPVNLTSAEIATDLAIKSWSKRILDPIMTSIAMDIDTRLMKIAQNTINNFVGTPGTIAGSIDTWLAANQKLDELLAPPDLDGKRFAILAPATNAAMVSARKGLFSPSKDVGEQNKYGAMDYGDGFKYLRSNLIPTFTSGTQAGSANALSAGATQSGSTIAIDTMTGAATIKKGTIVTFGGVYEIHPVQKFSYPYLKQFVVTADVTLSGGGAGNLTIFPALDASATGTQNASTTVADESVVTFLSGAGSTSFQQNLAFHKEFMRFCSVPLYLPDGTDMAAQETVDGITVRVIRDFLPLTDVMVMRVDVLWGAVAVRPEWAVRVTN